MTVKLEHLPPEVLVHIFKNLGLPDIRNVMLTSKFLWELILTSNKIWKSLCTDRMVVHNSLDNRKPNIYFCYNQYRISNNWCSGVYRNKVVIQHQINYMPWLIFHNSEVLLLSVGSELRCYPTDRNGHPLKETLWLWKLDVPKVMRNDIRTNDVSRFIVSGNLIACGNRDGSAAVFKFDHIRQKPRLLCHIEDCNENGLVEVSAVEMIPDAEKYCVVTGSIYSSNLTFWYCGNEENNKSDFSCNWASEIKLPHDVGIRCLSLNNTKDQLAIGLNGNCKPLLLDINTEQLVITDVNMNARQTVRDIRWHDENTILYVTHSGKMQLVDVRTHNVVYDVMDPFQSTLYCVKSDGHRAVVAGTSEYSRCVLFDVRNDACHNQMYFTQKKSSPVYSLDFDSTKLIAAADRSIAVLNFNINTSSAPRRDYSHTFEFVS